VVATFRSENGKILEIKNEKKIIAQSKEARYEMLKQA